MNNVIERMKTSGDDWSEALKIACYDSKQRIFPDDIEIIYAADDGENDGECWVCIGKLKDGRYFKLFAGCDYTGWDCRAGGNIEFHTTLTELLSINSLTPRERERLNDQIAKLEELQ